jgi:CDP-paratose 2-epimerase
MKILITGGLGFIGINAVKYFSKYNEVFIIDNMSRKGNYENYNEIKDNEKVTYYHNDITIKPEIELLFNIIQPDVVIHLAGQVAVTASIREPREDFECNVLGTFNILECIRTITPEAILIFSSTNKVYGEYKSDIIELDTRYIYENLSGVDEQTLLDFHSPYGCSKGSADQYVRDYARIYNIKSVVLRQSCIYGQNQYGIEDQGWVAWFTIAANYNKSFTIYGDGKQVRDILHVDDLVKLYEQIIFNIDKCKGEVINVGGGSENSMSLIELIKFLSDDCGLTLNYQYDFWRDGDQKIYISDISKLNKLIGWKPYISKEQGLKTLHEWVKNNGETFKELNLI